MNCSGKHAAMLATCRLHGWDLDGYLCVDHPLSLHITDVQGLSATKVTRLRDLAAAALDGRLDTERLRGVPVDEALAELQTLPGIGPWTAAEVGIRALGDVDAVSVGDFHLPNLVAFALAGEARGTDQRMLELLEPYRGHRARVIRLLELSGIRAPRFGPRLSGRGLEDL